MWLYDFSLWAAIIELAGALIIFGYAGAAGVSLLRQHDIAAARAIVADGAITGLSIKLAASLLKTIELHTWEQILIFVIIFTLRTILKRLFVWENRQVTHKAGRSKL